MIGQQLTALLLVLSLLLPFASLLLASAGTLAEVCQCCRRRDHGACRRSHAGPWSGPSLNASPECENRCGQSGGVASSTLFFAPEFVQVAGTPPRNVGLRVSSPSNGVSRSYSAWLYQRPPPLP